MMIQRITTSITTALSPPGLQGRWVLEVKNMSLE